MGKEYTYKDWIEGKIENESLTVLCAQYFFNESHNHSNSFIAPEEIKKIRDAQRDVFDMALFIISSSKIFSLKDKIEKAKDSSNWLKIEIDKIEKFINDNPDLEQSWEEDKREISGITSEKFHATKKIYDDLQKRIKSKKPSTAYVGITNGNRESSMLFEMYVNKEYLNALYDLSREYNKPVYSLEEKIEIWIDKNIPYSNNKEDYKRIFKIICEQPNPKECTIPYLLDKIHEEFEPSIDSQTIRKKIPNFKASFPF